MLVAGLCMSAMAGCPSTPEENGKGPDIEKVNRPAWTVTGEHSGMPLATHVVAMHSGTDGKPPTEGVMRRRLFAKLQGEIGKRLGAFTSEAFAGCLREGSWANEVLLPDLKIRQESHTDGFSAAAIAGVSREELAEAARASLERRNTVPLVRRLADLHSVASEPWAMKPTVYEDMLARHRNVSGVLDELALAALALADRAPEEKVDAALLASAVKIVNRADQFREYLGCRILQGNSPSANLGDTIPSIEFQLIWQGQLANGLPVRPLLAGLGGTIGQVSDGYGVVRSRRMRWGLSWTGTGFRCSQRPGCRARRGRRMWCCRRRRTRWCTSV
jgi:hypothetical protein